MKKKVLFVITKSNFGGAQKYVYDLATKLPREDFDVVVATGGRGLLVDKLHDQGIRTISLPSLERDVSILKDFASFIDLWRIFKNERPDIVHLNSAKASGLGALAGRCARIPKIIFTAHGWAFNEDRSFLARVIIKKISWITVMLCHVTIAVSNRVSSDMRWVGVGRKIVVIKNGIEQIDFIEREQAREHIGKRIHIEIPQNIFLMGTIAELHPNKGLSYAIEAFVRLVPDNPNLYYVILGDGQERERLNILIKQHNLEDRIFLAGFVENASRYLKAFDLFILSSITEALGYVLLEAGLAGLPVIATNIGGNPEIIVDGKSGLVVPPRKPDELAQAIEHMTRDPKQRNDFGRALSDSVVKNFTLDRMVSQTIALYNKTNR